jgi:hypothetical protein
LQLSRIETLEEAEAFIRQNADAIVIDIKQRLGHQDIIDLAIERLHENWDNPNFDTVEAFNSHPRPEELDGEGDQELADAVNYRAMRMVNERNGNRDSSGA